MPFLDRNMKELIETDPWSVHDLEPVFEDDDLPIFRQILIEMKTTYWSQDGDLYEYPLDPEGVVDRDFTEEQCSDDVLERYFETIFFQIFMQAKEELNNDDHRIRQTRLFTNVIATQLELKLPQRLAVEYLPGENLKPGRLPGLKYAKITAENDEFRINGTNPFNFRSENDKKPKPKGHRIKTAIKKPRRY